MERESEYRANRTVGNIFCESAGEYILPDYKGDVKKIILIKPDVILGGRFASGDRLEFTGTVVYNVVYLDGENNISSLDFSTDYQLETKCDGENYVDAVIIPKITNYNLRLIGPRKFSAKASLEAICHVIEDRKYVIEGDAFEAGTPECSTKEIKIRCTNVVREKEKHYREELVYIDDAIEDEVQVLLCSAEADNISVNVGEAVTEIRGEYKVSALVARDGELPQNYSGTVQFCESISNEEHFEADPISNINITSLKASINPSENGVSVAVDITSEIELILEENQALTVCLDTYMQDTETENEYNDFNYNELIGSVSFTENFFSELDKQEQYEENIRNVIYTYATASCESTEIKDKACKICGKMRFNCIACEVLEDGGVGYSSIKLDVPFCINANFNCQIPQNSRIEYEIKPISASVNVDANKLCPSAVLSVNVKAVAPKAEHCVLKSSVTDNKIQKDFSTIKVYYPTSEDTLFDIAKRYHTTVMDIAAENSLSESVFMAKDSKMALSGIKKLIIK